MFKRLNRGRSVATGIGSRCLVALLAATLTGCATPLATRDAEALFHDRHFSAPGEAPDATTVFALSPAMQAYLASDMAQAVRRTGKLQGLVDALYSRNQLRLEYDAAFTRNAAEAFDARAGNCLSLVIMTAAFAKALGLLVQYQRVLVDDRWRLAGDLALATGHVNLALARDLNTTRGEQALYAAKLDRLPATRSR